MIAIKRLQNILWILIVAFGALSAYLISLRVATERNAVEALERRIHAVRSNMRYLETEFEARANMRQLEKWNAEDFRYVAPQAAQYLPGERALAHLDGIQPNGELYVAPPVMMAMAESETDSPEAAVSRAPSPAPAQIRQDEAILRAASASAATTVPAKVQVKSDAPAVPSTRLAQADRPAASDAVARKAARMAMLDQTLLDDSTLRDIGARAAVEVRRGANR